MTLQHYNIIIIEDGHNFVRITYLYCCYPCRQCSAT